MCISLMIAGTLLSVGGSIMGAMQSSAAADSQAKWNEYNLTVQNNQLKNEQDMTRLKAQETEAARLAEDRRMRGNNYAFLAASGAAENISFFEGADKANAEAAARDVGTLRLNSTYQTNRIADQIAVNKANIQFGYQKADMESTSAFIKAGTNIASSVASFGSSYYKYKT
jgi:hypothetical protein